MTRHVNTSVAAKAAEVLDLELEGLTKQMVTGAYRNAAKECHPDTGTFDPARWNAIGQAQKVLLDWLERRARALAPPAGPGGNCRACSGTGRIKQGLSKLQMLCVMCGGSGNTEKEKE